MIKEAVTIEPLITERAFAGVNKGWYSFLVRKNVNKRQAVKLVEELFGVKVEEIKSSVMKGKKKRQPKSRKWTKGPDRKKIIVRLAKGQKIDIFETSSQGA